MRQKFKIVLILLAIAALPAWRFWPSSLETILPRGLDGVVRMSCSVQSHRIDSGEPHIDMYDLKEAQMTAEQRQDILEILASSKYRRDLRNLIPWGIDGVGVTGNLQSAYLFWVYDEEQACVMVSFMKNDTFVLHGDRGMKIFHPTDREMLARLVKYVQENGTAAD